MKQKKDKITGEMKEINCGKLYSDKELLAIKIDD